MENIGEDLWIPNNDTLVENASSVISENNNGTLKYNQTVDVRVPKSSVNDMVAIRITSIKKIKKNCEDAKKNKFSWCELFLGLSTLFAGGFLSAIISQIKYESKFLSIFLYSICPTIAVALFVAYIFCRKSTLIDAKSLAEVVEEALTDFDCNEEVI